MNRAIFLDRDNTIINQVGDIATHRPKDVEFLPFALDGLCLLSKLTDYKLIIVTNQSGIGVGKYTEKAMKKTMKYIYKQFKKHDLNVEKKYYYCPHKPGEICHCRKPESGMLEQAIEYYNLNPWESWMIGDKGKDIDAGASVGCRTILVETGDQLAERLSITTPTFRVENLFIAAYYILLDDWSKKCRKS